jgi:hypothetical protein
MKININSIVRIIITAICSLMMILTVSCNNPFSTREPQKPSSGGVSIKPQTTPENVLGNLEASMEGLSSTDYMNIYSDDFVFHPDPDDSVLYEQEFAGGWNYERETQFANNFLQSQNFKPGMKNPIQLEKINVEYKPGEGMYDYRYLFFISLADSNDIYEGEAWIYLRQDKEGKWSIYKWVDKRLTKNSKTLGALKAKNI